MKKQDKTPVRVLVVDDSAESVELIKRNLESIGYLISTANSVQSALALLASVEVDLVITDLKKWVRDLKNDVSASS